MKVLTVVGARPQFIKAAMISKAFARKGDIQEVIVHTGQHYDFNMSKVFFDEMGIPPPQYHLGIGGGTHGSMTGRQIEKIESILLDEQPDCLLVYGDTNSTLAGALAAVKLAIPVAHVEAGLRNFDLSIPEDVNRILTDRIASLLFCSTDTAIRNLQREGFDSLPCQIFKTGDLMADAFYHFSQGARLDHDGHPYVLCTIHRDFNTKPDVLRAIIEGLSEVSRAVDIVFPVHPRTRQAIQQLGVGLPGRIKLIDPVGYLEMLDLLAGCDCVITDSGGLQREAYMAGKKSLLLLSYTPWEELITSGCSLLCEPSHEAIISGYRSLGDLRSDFSQAFYGSGESSDEIVSVLYRFLAERRVSESQRNKKMTTGCHEVH